VAAVAAQLDGALSPAQGGEPGAAGGERAGGRELPVAGAVEPLHGVAALVAGPGGSLQPDRL
jgi:hypothetical protein